MKGAAMKDGAMKKAAMKDGAMKKDGAWIPLAFRSGC